MNQRYLPLIAFAALGLIWGSNFIYMKFAMGFITPMQVMLLRLLFGFLPVAIYALATGALKREHLNHTHHFVVMALLATVLYYFCFVKGVSLLYSGIAGALSGATPLFSFILGVLFLAEEKASARKIIGLLIGLGGVLCIAKPFGATFDHNTWLGVLYMVLGSLCLGASFIYARRFLSRLAIPGPALTTYQLFLATLMAWLITDTDGITTILSSTAASWGMVIGLGLLGTGLAYLIYYFIIEKLGAVTAASVTYIPPVIALLIGAFIGREPISLPDYTGTLLILAGVMLLNTKRRQVQMKSA